MSQNLCVSLCTCQNRHSENPFWKPLSARIFSLAKNSLPKWNRFIKMMQGKKGFKHSNNFQGEKDFQDPSLCKSCLKLKRTNVGTLKTFCENSFKSRISFFKCLHGHVVHKCSIWYEKISLVKCTCYFMFMAFDRSTP